MSWALYRWTWRVRAPLYLGRPPAGSLNRTRLFVPARAMWGALTAELTRHEAKDGAPKYEDIGGTLRDRARIGYLFPAEYIEGKWRAWLPEYRGGNGLVWKHEDTRKSHLSDRSFRHRILDARPGTSIDPRVDAAEDGSLRETECIQTRWRGADGFTAPGVAMTGYVFLREDTLRHRMDSIRQVFVGGDTRYGLGLMEREGKLVPDERFFGDCVELDGDSPIVATSVLRAHAAVGESESSLSGARERVVGWDGNRLDAGEREEPRWAPGSKRTSRLGWHVLDRGTWAGTSESRAPPTARYG